MHPLAPDLSSLSDDDVHKKLSDLQKRYQQAYRFGPQQLLPQIQMMLQHYQDEVQRRNKQQMSDLQKKTEEKGLKNIIDIQ
jgi:hypothetical protein